MCDAKLGIQDYMLDKLLRLFCIKRWFLSFVYFFFPPPLGTLLAITKVRE